MEQLLSLENAEKLVVEAHSKRQEQLDAAETRLKVLNIETRTQTAILKLSLRELRDALQNDLYTAVEVLAAYSTRALEVHRRTNCLIAFFVEAFDEAAKLDATMREIKKEGEMKTKEKKPPLFGIPFSVKWNQLIDGYDNSCGLLQFFNAGNAPSSAETTPSSLVTHLRSLGAVPFVQTNAPQGQNAYTCSSPIYGATLHPLLAGEGKTPGGTCGGEACLVAGGGSPFGMNGDSGGSLRVPAVFCGLVTLKPTAHRLTVRGSRVGMPGRGRCYGGNGFITRCVDDQLLLLGQFFGSEAYAKLAVPKSIPLPLNSAMVEEIFSTYSLGGRRLRVGYFFDDGYLSPTPGCRRAVVETVHALRRKTKLQLIEFPMPWPQEAASLTFKALLPDGGAYHRELFAKEPLIDPNIAAFVESLRRNMNEDGTGKDGGAGSIDLIDAAEMDNSPQSRVFKAAQHLETSADVRSFQAAVDAYSNKLISLWHEAGLDALICPAFTMPAVGHSYCARLPHCRFATAMWNMLDFTAGVVPVGRWTKGDEEELQKLRNSESGANHVVDLMREAASNSIGLPLAIQVVGLPYREEMALGVMKTIESNMSYSENTKY